MPSLISSATPPSLPAVGDEWQNTSNRSVTSGAARRGCSARRNLRHPSPSPTSPPTVTPRAVPLRPRAVDHQPDPSTRCRMFLRPCAPGAGGFLVGHHARLPVHVVRRRQHRAVGSFQSRARWCGRSARSDRRQGGHGRYGTARPAGSAGHTWCRQHGAGPAGSDRSAGYSGCPRSAGRGGCNRRDRRCGR